MNQDSIHKFEQLELDLGVDFGYKGMDSFTYNPTEEERHRTKERQWSIQDSKECIVNYLLNAFLNNKVLEYRQTSEKVASGWVELRQDPDYFQQGLRAKKRGSVEYNHTHFINSTCELILTEVEGVDYKYKVTIKRKDSLVYDVVLGTIYLNNKKVADTEEEFMQV